MTSKSCWKMGIGGKRRLLQILRPRRCTGNCNLCVILRRYGAGCPMFLMFRTLCVCSVKMHVAQVVVMLHMHQTAWCTF